jgi:hypothetical protein
MIMKWKFQFLQQKVHPAKNKNKYKEISKK